MKHTNRIRIPDLALDVYFVLLGHGDDGPAVNHVVVLLRVQELVVVLHEPLQERTYRRALVSHFVFPEAIPRPGPGASYSCTVEIERC